MTTIFKTITNSIKHWYVPMILGVIFVLCGIYTFMVPVEAYITLSIVFSLSFLVSGISETFFALQNTKSLHGWGWYLVDGLLGILIGVYLLAYPDVSMATLPFVVGFVLLFRSFQLLGFALDLKDHKVTNANDLILTSVLGIILSFLLLSSPIFTSVSVVVLTGTALVFVGIASISLSYKLKKIKDAPEKLDATIKQKISDLQDEINQYVNR